MTRLLTLLSTVAAIVVTATERTPAPLPDLALGSSLLFHLERIAALLAALIVIGVLVQRASSGQLPIELSTQGIKYAAEEEKTAQGLINDTRRLDESLARMERRLNAIEDRS
jgi:hypothetical protein